MTLKIVCDKCDVRLPKNRPKLICSFCKIIKHYRCQRLSRAEAQSIVDDSSYQWTCAECFAWMLPVNACAAKTSRNVEQGERFKQKCFCCSGYSYSQKNVSTCPWCNEISHKKCLNGSLGCNNCCDRMIPGFRVHNYELYDNIGIGNTYIFNPYDHTHHANVIGDMIASEEEHNNVWSEISNFLTGCNYKQPKHIPESKINELNMLSLNIRSLNKNIGLISDNICEYQKYDVLSFNETNCNIEKLANGIDDLLLEGFHPPIIQSPARTTNKGGGLALYVNERVCLQDDIEKIDLGEGHPNPDGELLFVKIKECKKVKRPLIIGSVYRSPSRQPGKFNELLETVLQKIDRNSNKHIILLGDFNIDLIKHDRDINSQNVIDMTTNYGFVQIISRPTRITDHSATLIDHIYTNKINKVISSSVVTHDLSDHLSTLVTISLDTNFDNVQWNNSSRQSDTDKHEYRIYNEANNETFKRLITDEIWDIPEQLDAQSQYDLFVETYTKHYNTAYPLNTKRIRRKKERLNPKPWILPWLEEACDRKNALYFDWINNRTLANETKYKKMKKFVDKHIKMAKSKYYKKYFEQHKENSKKQWSMINKLLNRNHKKSGVSKLLDSNGEIINTPIAIAEKFNDYFCNIASNLKSQIASRNAAPSQSFENFLTDPVTNTIYLKPVDSGEVFKIINNMKNKATLDTKVSALKIANSSPKFTETLAKLITSSFEQGIFPQTLKLARVVPVHKGGSKTDVSNYRPISLLTSFSKIYEKLMHNRLTNFMETHDSFYEMQYGFRSGRSCEHALLNAQSILLNNLNKNQISLLLLIDFSKAFDMVEHSILLKKLEHYGIRGIALEWLKSYLNNREQFVSVNGKDSSKRHIKYGVPQGSILGPLLFVIYINDIPGIYKFAKFILYADDANIIITGKNMAEINEQVEDLAVALLGWVDSNGLALNLKKTMYMIFSRRRIDDNYNLVIANTHIKRTREAKFLGVIVDDKLTWTQHTKALKTKMSRYIGIMYKIKNQLPIQAKLQIFHSFVQSHLNFCSIIWGFSSKANIESLFSGQKKGMRAVMPGFVNYFYKDGCTPSHTKLAFNNNNVLTVQGVIAKNALIFMHKIYCLDHSSSIPSSVSATIPGNAPRNGNDHVSCQEWLAEYGTTYYRNSIFFKGPLLCNDPKYKELCTPTALLSVKAFKNNVNRMLLQLQRLGDEQEWQSNNFWLYSIKGLRTSDRLNNGSL